LGYKTLIAWMVDLASRMFDRYPDSPNPLAEPAVVLIDEIDLHLHPKWQRTLMSYLSERFPNTQFIATAHSPLVVQAASDANVVLLRREGDHVVIDNNMKDIHGWRVDQILTSDLFGLESARPPQLDPLLMGNARPKPERLAEKLLQIRNALGLSQPQIHNRLGVEDLIEYNEVSKYELGKREPPLKILLQYARLAGVYMEDIADDELDLPEKLPGNVRYEGIKRKHTIRGKSKR
jgi:transcriptional regulator with XRE-family HTH domain